MFTSNKINKAVKVAMSLGAASAFAFAANVAAQEEQGSTEAKDTVERIEVTGSRILRTGAIAPSPVTVISGEQLIDTGAMNIGEVLARLPALGTTYTLANSGRFIGTAGVSLLDLRNMGTSRTLVLVDGRRHVAGSPGTASVDTNSIPSTWIDRVEIITGGASAVYGADAVTGVVNFILKKNVQGLDVTATKGFAEDNPYQNEKYTFSYGTDFANGRGNAAFAVEYNAQNSLNALDHKTAKTSWSGLGYTAVTGLNRTPDQLDLEEFPDTFRVRDSGYYSISEAGSFNVGGNWYTFNSDGTHRPTYLGTVFDTARQFCQDDCDYINLNQYNEIQPKFSRVNYNFKTNYEFSDDLSGHFDAKFVSSKGQNIGQPFFRFGNATGAYAIKRDNAYITPELATLMDTSNVTQLNINRMFNDGGRRLEDNTRETYRFVAGLEGNLTEDWAFDTSLVHGRTKIERVNNANLIIANYQNSIDAVRDAGGNIVCRNEAARAAGCVPTSIFGKGAMNQAALDYIYTTSTGTAEVKQSVVTFNVNNSSLFELPAGYVGFAAGVEYRKETSKSVEDPLAKSGATFFNALGEIDGSFNVREVYAEFSVPLLADLFLIDNLVFDAAARHADYSTIGDATSWKLGLDWSVMSELRARFTVSEALRAPNITELFRGQGQSFGSVADRCRVTQLNNLSAEGRARRAANCAALGVPADFDSTYDSRTMELLVGGNPELQPEKSRSYTAGFVYQPEWLTGLSFTVDYWKIDIEDTISSVTPQRTLDECLDAESIDNQYCALITRNPATSEITLIRNFQLNISRSVNSGVDFEVGYDFDAFNGRFRTSLIATKLIEAKQYPFQNQPQEFTDYSGVLGDADLQARLSLDYSQGAWSVGTRTRYVNGVELYTPTQITSNPNPSNEMRYGSYFITDVSAGYKFENNLSLRIGIDNVFDRGLPGTTIGNGAGSAIYDNIGRFGYARVAYSF